MGVSYSKLLAGSHKYEIEIAGRDGYIRLKLCEM